MDDAKMTGDWEADVAAQSREKAIEAAHDAAPRMLTAESQELIAQVGRAIKRLDRSTTRQTRRNALKQFRSLVRDIEAAYPILRPDGSAIIRPRRRGIQCPFCRVPMGDVATLLTHLLMKHKGTMGKPTSAPEIWECPCGHKCGPTGMIQHVRAADKKPGGLGAHFAKAILISAGRR